MIKSAYLQYDMEKLIELSQQQMASQKRNHEEQERRHEEQMTELQRCHKIK